MENLNFREILVKKPFYELKPDGYMSHGTFSDKVGDRSMQNMPYDPCVWRVKTQSDFLREYFTSGHRIWDKKAYPDIIKENHDWDPEDPSTGNHYYLQPITRCAFAFQQVIATKHTLHLTGNDIQFELADSTDELEEEEESQKNLNVFKKGWLMHNMEIAFFEAVSSYMIVAETAAVGYIDKGKFGVKVLSFKNGDYLYPHYDSITGELSVFARKYYDLDEDGNAQIEWVEVWDDTYYYRFRNDVGKKSVTKKAANLIKGLFGMNGYALAEKKEHHFNSIPVAYIRNDEGPCWSNVQKNIEDYEEAFSYLCENNKAYAFPVFYVKGDGEEITISGDDMTGAAKVIAMNSKDNDAGFLNGTDASEAFATQLNKSYDLIYELSFTVKPPELKSGDLPGVAIKLLYSPALEVAMNDSQKLQPFLDKLVEIAKFGIGHENNATASIVGLDINAWIEPYTHQNKSELLTNLATAVQNGFLSKQTASERCPDFPKNAEWERILREKKEEDQQDLLMDIQRADNETENAIEEQEATARINKQQGGNDINTGGGRKAGRPNRSGKKWDKNHNNDVDDKNNWKHYNQTH